MSRKRSKKAPEVIDDVVSSDVDAIVDEEVLAEGSGPIATAPAVSDEELAASAEPVDHLVAIELSPEEQDLGTDDEEIEGEIEGEIEAATLPTAAAAMDAAELKKLVEALVFASDKPVTVQRLRQLTRVSDTKRLEAMLHELQSDYADRGLILTSVSGGWQFRTRPQFSAWVQQLIAGRPVRLTRAQLETLAIIAYRQPITRPEIDDIRGVDSSATLKLLLDRTLIRVLGKKEEVGRPLLYGTTKEFLDFFSLGDLRELPTLREYSELSDESRQVMSDRLGIEPDGTVDYNQTEDLERPESIEPAADASTLSDLAEKYLREEREAEANVVSAIDVDAMPGILADLHGDSIVEGDSLSAEPLITDDIVDADDAIDPDAFGANEPE